MEMIHTSLISWSSNAWFCLLDTFPSFPYKFLSINNLCYSHIGYFEYTQIQGNFNFIDALDNNSLIYRFIYLLSLFLIISIPEFFLVLFFWLMNFWFRVVEKCTEKRQESTPHRAQKSSSVLDVTVNCGHKTGKNSPCFFQATHSALKVV